MELWELHRGESQLVINVPHAGTHLPVALQQRMTVVAQDLADTDWHVEKLYDFAKAEGATLMCATHSRYVIDLNRHPSGAPLYAGADNTELCPTRTFANEALYGDGEMPQATEIDRRRATYFDVYHAALAAEIDRVRARHGYAVLLDGHSIRSEVPRFFSGRLPDLNLGTVNGAACAMSLEACAAQIIYESSGFTSAVNGRFKGGWITRHYGNPERNVHALQLEIAQPCYMDEAPPYPWHAARAASLDRVLRRLCAALGAWRPSA